MSASKRQPLAEVNDTHLVLYDGDCGLCSRLVQFVLKHDRRGVFRFASLQSDVGRTVVERCGGDPNELATFFVVAGYQRPDARALTKSAAALFVAHELGWPWRALQLARVLPQSWLDGGYDRVASIRYAVFGRRERCLVPPPQFEGRFIESGSRGHKVNAPAPSTPSTGEPSDVSGPSGIVPLP